MRSRRSDSVLQPDLFSQTPKEVLEDAQWTFGPANGKDVYELCLNLVTPAIVTADKANAPVVGLPTLDGFLCYVAFRAALDNALIENPELSKQLIWQWNVALRHQEMWIDFELPLRKIPLKGLSPIKELSPMFDCSLGLPIHDDGKVLIPVGSFFTPNGDDLITYPEAVDSLPLRRLVNEPWERPIQLKSKLDTSRGSTKALDNRLYFPLTKNYVFFFRGDKSGVERLLEFAIDKQIGLGKKTTLGYGQIASFDVTQRPDIKATWAKPLSGLLFKNDSFALIKNLPYDRVFARREKSDTRNQELFGCRRFSLVATIETFGAYCPPYWLREKRTQIVRYGSIIQARLEN